MKKISILAILLLIFINANSQQRFTANVLDWVPPAGSDGDTLVKTNMTFSNDYLLGLSFDCEYCDSVWVKYVWGNGTTVNGVNINVDSCLFNAPLIQAGSPVDSVFLNGNDVTVGVYSEHTPYPFNGIVVNKVGNTMFKRLLIKRTITSNQ